MRIERERLRRAMGCGGQGEGSVDQGGSELLRRGKVMSASENGRCAVEANREAGESACLCQPRVWLIYREMAGAVDLRLI